MVVSYQLESYPALDSASLSTSLNARRSPTGSPSPRPKTIRGMLEHADIIVTARSGGLLVGISRAITDHSFCTYLSDLAVDVDYQISRNRKGVDPPYPRIGRAPHHAHPAGRPQGTHLLPSCRNASSRLMLDHSP